MKETTRQRAYKCLLRQGGYAPPEDPAINFRKAYVVNDEIFLTEDAAERATHEHKPHADMEVLTYSAAYQFFYPQILENGN